jgi:PA14 domain
MKPLYLLLKPNRKKRKAFVFFTTLCIFLSLSMFSNAQTPGGVSTGTTRGYRVDYYNGSFSNETQFGAGSANATPSLWGYTGYISGNEFYGYDNDNFALEYTGTLEIATTGNYTFRINGDDKMYLYIDGVLRAASVNPNPASVTINLTAGNHTIKVKHIENYGWQSATVELTAGPGISSTMEVDGRFVRVDNAALAAWYKASDITVTPNFSGSTSRVNTWVNNAPAFIGHGNLSFSGINGFWSKLDDTTTNFNPSARFDDLDKFSSPVNQNGLVYRSGTRSMFLIDQHTDNVSWAHFLAGQAGGDHGGTNNMAFYKPDQFSTGFIRSGWVNPTVTTTYVANESKLFTGILSLGTGTAASVNNTKSMSANGGTSATHTAERITNYNNNGGALELGGLGGSYASITSLPEFIYYPFALSTNEQQRVNTYLAVKYGVTLEHNYLNTSSNIIWNRTTNTGYNNRIFGIGREMAAEGLNQKQSRPYAGGNTSGADFLVIGKGPVTTTNAANTGTLADGDYLILGDNNGALANQTTEIPAAYQTAAGCATGRLTREWKVQVTGAPGAISLRAGSLGSGFKFLGFAAGVTLLIDTDGDGDFTTGTVNTVAASSYKNGVATFANATIPNGAVITFAYIVTSPGGVNTSLKLWVKGDDGTLTGNNTSVSEWTNQVDATYNPNQPVGAWQPKFHSTTKSKLINFNPSLEFDGVDDQLTKTGTRLFNNNLPFYMATVGVDQETIRTDFRSTMGLGADANYPSLDLQTDGTSPNGWNPWMSGSSPAEWNGGVGNPAILFNGNTGGTGQRPQMYNLSSANATNVFNANLNNVVSRIDGFTETTTLDAFQQFEIGNGVFIGSGSDGKWTGLIPEALVYSQNLSADDNRKVQSYLAVKYGMTFNQAGMSNAYVASDLTPIYNHTTHWNNIFGIGRDDCSGLNQKQSKSTASGDHITIGLNKIDTTNAANTGSFASNKQFLMIGNDGGSLLSTNTDVPAGYAASCNGFRYVREWKVKNTNGLGAVQVQIGDAANRVTNAMANPQLAIDNDGDGNFATGTITLVPVTSTKGGVATFDNVTFADGAVFTMVFTLSTPGGLRKPATGTDIGGVTHVNGLAYKLYSTAYAGTADISGTVSGTLLSTGYLNNATQFHLPFTSKINDNFLVELTGKLYVPTGTATYRFRFPGTVDDQMALIINGVVRLNVTSVSGTVTSADITLSAGYHDIVIRGNEVGGGENFNLEWNGGSGSTYTAIPDVNYFVAPVGPSAWYDATDNAFSTLTDATPLVNGTHVLYDNSINANDLGTITGSPVYYNTTKTKIRNYNPSITFADQNIFTNNYLKGFAYGKQGRSLFGVGSMKSTISQENMTGYGIDATDGNMAIFKSNTQKLGLALFNNDLIGTTTWFAASDSTHILEARERNNNINTTNHATVFVNHLADGSKTRTQWSLRLNDQSQLNIGNIPDVAASNGWDGNINEVVYYPWDLTTAERLRVNSYLALKWGITLNQGTPTDYIAADGVTTMWNSGLNTSFKYDITGIGRDDCSSLHQSQSTATDGGDIISMALDSFATTNETNKSRFANNNSFLTWSHNNGSFTPFNSNVPPAMATNSCYVRVNRIWQAQVVNNPGTVSIEAGKLGLLSFNRGYYKPVLLISNTTDFSSATVVNASRVSKGIATFKNVTLTHGQYFTIALIQAAPGGINTNMKVWFEASSEAYTDIAQTNLAETEGETVSSWGNISVNPIFTKVEQNNNARKPMFKASVFNFNPAIRFDKDVMISPVNISTTDYRSATSMTSVLAGANNSTGANDNVFWFHFDGNILFNRKTSMERQGAYWSSNSVLNRTPVVTDPEIYTWTHTNTANNFKLYSNLTAVATGTSTDANSITAPFRLGADVDNPEAAGFGAKFDLGEFVIYNDNKGAPSTAEMRRIHSYYAIKYGYTLDATAMGNQYIASNGSTITYDYTTHWNRITGIGMDDCSALDQKQSKSKQSGALVTIALGTTLYNSNAENPNEFVNSSSFNVFGDNGKAISWTGVDYLQNSLMRLNRVWRLKETGTVGTVVIQVPGSSSSEATKLPPSPDPNDAVYLIVAPASSNGSFKGALTYIEMIPDVVGATTTWTTTYDFADGDYYTFGTKKTCLAPAGITDGTTVWYKTTNNSLGAIAPNTANALVDSHTGTHALNRNGNGTATIVAGSATSFNYNRSLTLTGNAAFTKINVNEDAVISPDAGTMFATATSPSSLFVTNNGVPFKAGINNAPIFMGNSGGAFSSSTLPNIYQMRVGSTNINGTQNGTAVTSGVDATFFNASNSYSIGLGTFDAGGTYNNGKVAEAIAYNRELLTPEQQVVNTYFAIKYGQTLSHNYYTPDYDGTNAATSTLYDISTYGNRVFGIGADTVSCFAQKQSTSQLAGSLLKFSITSSIASENNGNAGTILVDRSFAAAGDDDGDAASWVTGTIPALYTNICATPNRIARQWKVKAINSEHSLFVTIPDNSASAATKLPSFPVGYDKVYMVVNNDPDFSINANQEELEMTLNPVSKEWEITYTFPNGTYKYVTFVTKPTNLAALPIAIGSGTQDGNALECNSAPYFYYKGVSNVTNAIIAVNPNGNTWAPTSLTVNNEGNLTGGGGTFTNSGAGYYQSTNGVNSLRVTKRLHTIVAPGTFNVGGGVTVRVFYVDADTTAMLTDAFPGAASIQAKGWFKHTAGSAAGVVSDMTPVDLPGAVHMEPVAWGTDQGVKYVEFLVSSFSTFGYYAKSTAYTLPLELRSFTGKCAATSNQLNWVTESESNTSHFEVEKSKDGNVFEKTTMVIPAAGNSSAQITYSAQDAYPFSGKTYYRLKMADKDGKFTYSSIISIVDNCNNQAKVYASPNPVQDLFTVYNLGTGLKTIAVYDASGKLKAQYTTSGTQFNINAGKYSSGLITLRINRNGVFETIKIIKK